MRHFLSYFAPLGLLLTSAAQAVEVPRGDLIPEGQRAIALHETGVFPDGIKIGDQTHDTLYVDPRGVVTLGRALPQGVAPRPLADVGNMVVIAPFWRTPEVICGQARLGKSVADAVTISWFVGVGEAGCGDAEARFAVELRPRDDGGLWVTFLYEKLPGSDPARPPRVGVALGETVVEFLPDDPSASRDRAKLLTAIGTDGEAGVWVIELDGDWNVLGDGDGDGIRSGDNCPLVSNPWQINTDGDDRGDVCDDNDDNDRFPDRLDNCPLIVNDDQHDLDGNGVGDECDDIDGDGLLDVDDLCPFVADGARLDLDRDGIGDACDADADGDGLYPLGSPWATKLRFDRCPFVFESVSRDTDQDGIGDECDIAPLHRDAPGVWQVERDSDGDGIPDVRDLCPTVADRWQGNVDHDGLGDACDPDANGDGIIDFYAE